MKLFETRKDQEEWMDMPSTSREDFVRALEDIQWVNERLGGTQAIVDTLFKHMRFLQNQPVSILDLGTGSADIPLALAQTARSKQRNVEILAVDLNETAVQVARETTLAYPEIQVLQADALALPYADQTFDWVISSMFMHHLKQAEAVHLLQEMSRLARCGFIINDLERHPLAYAAISILGKVTRKGRVFMNDAPLSVLRGFTRSDLESLKEQSGLPTLEIQHRRPYRWILTWTRP